MKSTSCPNCGVSDAEVKDQYMDTRELFDKKSKRTKTKKVFVIVAKCRQCGKDWRIYR